MKRIIIASIATFGVALLLSAFWWLPLLSDIRYSDATSFPVEAASEFSATFLQAITLRPDLCCAHSSAYGSAGSILLEILRILPLALVLLGFILNRRDRYVWFFAASAFVAILLAMGPESPINLFGVAYRHIPFFTRLRTPVRFLLFGSLAYAILIGFCVQAIRDRLGRVHIGKTAGVSISILVLVSLTIVGNTWQETRTAFSTFDLPNDEQNALDWLKNKRDGDYRIADPPFDAYVYDPTAGYIIRPTYWTYLHGKENVYGPGTSVAVSYTANVLDYLYTKVEQGSFDMSQWLSIFNVRYVLIDKTNPLSSNVILDQDFARVWTSDTIDIYQNLDEMPRVFSVSLTNERPVALWNGDRIEVSATGSGSSLVLSLDTRYARSHDCTLRITYPAIEPVPDSTGVAISVKGMTFSPDDAVHLTFYADEALPGISLNLSLTEQDGSTYAMELYRADGIKEGWNEINFPISLLALSNSTDENNRLDLDQIQTLQFGPVGQFNTEFSLYLDAVSIVAQEIDTSVDYEMTRPGEYKVHSTLDTPSYLVLSESYHPYWEAHATGSEIHSQIMYECLNAFYLQPGEQDVTLVFTTSPLRTAGNVISGVVALLVCSTSVFLFIRRWRQMRMTRGNSQTAKASLT